MAYLRDIGSEFHVPADVREGAFLNLPYLQDFDRYQHYLDGKLWPLFQWGSRGGEQANQLNGLRFFQGGALSTDPQSTDNLFLDARYAAIWQVNLFRSVTDFFEAAVWEQSPVVVDAGEEVEKRWEVEGKAIIRQARRATRWLPAKGRGVLLVEERFAQGGTMPALVAADPAGYFPMVDYIDRNLQVGHLLLRFWRSGERHPSDLGNRVTATVFVTEEQARMSDGRIPGPVNQQRTFYWPGGVSGNIGAPVSGETGSRVQGIWTFGDDDSVFAEMESNVLEILVSLSLARASMTRHPFPFLFLPPDIDDSNRDSQGRPTYNLLDPVVRAPASAANAGSGNIWGYSDNPAPMLSDGFMNLAAAGENFLAYVASSPKEAFGLSEPNTEQHEGALNHLQQIFKTKVIDTRDDLSVILPEVWALLGGPEGVRIEWEHEPFARSDLWRNAIIEEHRERIISTKTAQALLGRPIEEIDDGMDTAGGGINSGNGTDSNGDNDRSGSDRR